MCSKLDVFYYYKSRRRYRVWPEPAVPGIKLPIRKNRVELQQTLRGYDAIVIEVNEVLTHELGFGFVEDACRALGIATVPGPGR